jgi:hypothetical protein
MYGCYIGIVLLKTSNSFSVILSSRDSTVTWRESQERTL